MKQKKSIIIGLVAALVIVVGILLVPNTASAETVSGSNGIIYVKDSAIYDFKTYWNEKKAPVKEGYIFAGWYSEASDGMYLTEADAKNTTEAWAKFVPDYVLSVRAQIEADTVASDGVTDIRVLSSVDSGDYLNVGFDIWLANRKQLTMEDGSNPLITTKAFRNILVNGETKSATETFGTASQYYVVWKLTSILDANDSKIIYVRPYWITMDGTKVEGLAKYVHVEDGYLGYINVPINLMSGEDIAAGIVKMTYPTDLEFVGFEEGRLLTEMAENHLAEGSIKMVGNAKDVDEHANADGIYANLRFKKPTTLPSEDDFTTTTSDFSDWTEEDVEITPIIQY